MRNNPLNTRFDVSGATILVVDDIASNLKIVASSISDLGCDVIPVLNGLDALKRLEMTSVDLILLDLMMPEISGLETCRRIKANPQTAKIPIIFLTASKENHHLSEAYEAGGIDYLTKPFNPVELHMRIATHLSLRRALETLEKTNTELNELIHEKAEILKIAAHDLKNPLAGVKGYCQLMLRSPEWNLEQRQNGLDHILNGAMRMHELIQTLLASDKYQNTRLDVSLGPTDLVSIVRRSVSVCEGTRIQKDQKIQIAVDPGIPEIHSDQRYVPEIVDNLLSNALKFSERGQTVSVAIRQSGDQVVLSVSDEGPGIPENERSQVFLRYNRLTNRPTGGENSTGLGLSIVKRLTDLIGADISLDSEVGRGSTFSVAFPVAVQRGQDQQSA